MPQGIRQIVVEHSVSSSGLHDHVHRHTPLHTPTHAQTHAHTQRHTHTSLHTPTHVQTHAHTPTDTCTDTRPYTHTHIQDNVLFSTSSLDPSFAVVIFLGFTESEQSVDLNVRCKQVTSCAQKCTLWGFTHLTSNSNCNIS